MRQSGQALLIVLLSMSVVLTIVLSILSFSVTDIAITSREEEALRAFSAAEAGVEEALLTPGIGIYSNEIGDDSEYSAQVSGVAVNESSFAYPKDISPDSVASLHFVTYDDSGGVDCSSGPCFTGSDVKICWGKEDGPDTAIEATFYFLEIPGDSTSIAVARAVYDPDASRRASNNFSALTNPSSCTIEDKEYPFQTTINFASLGVNNSGLLFARVRPLYSLESTPVGFDVAGFGNLPSQGFKAESTGTAGEATRKIEVTRLLSTFPMIFESALSAPNQGISK